MHKFEYEYSCNMKESLLFKSLQLCDFLLHILVFQKTLMVSLLKYESGQKLKGTQHQEERLYMFEDPLHSEKNTAISKPLQN